MSQCCNDPLHGWPGPHVVGASASAPPERWILCRECGTQQSSRSPHVHLSAPEPRCEKCKHKMARHNPKDGSCSAFCGTYDEHGGGGYVCPCGHNPNSPETPDSSPTPAPERPWGTQDGPCPRCGHTERHYWSVPTAVCDGCGGQCTEVEPWCATCHGTEVAPNAHGPSLVGPPCPDCQPVPAPEPSGEMTTVDELRRDHPDLMKMAEENLAESIETQRIHDTEIAALRAEVERLKRVMRNDLELRDRAAALEGE